MAKDLYFYVCWINISITVEYTGYPFTVTAGFTSPVPEFGIVEIENLLPNHRNVIWWGSLF